MTCRASKIRPPLDAIASEASRLTELIGSRVCCDRCAPTTGTRGARCACAAAVWLERWEPRARAGQRRSRARPRGVPRRGAGRGIANVTSTPRTASACSCSTVGFAGEVSLGSVQRGPFQMGYVGYWIDEALRGQRLRPRRRRADHAVRVRRCCSCTGSRPRSCPATRRAGGSRRSSGCATKAPRVRLPADPRRVRGSHPLRDDGRGVARARPRARRPSSCTAETPRVVGLSRMRCSDTGESGLNQP